ncbi:hypothetical protein NP511_05900 [Natrinema thermotolerans]|uniref:Archaeal Type IV pilin N-terminal domain-containing protein n=1 Tax=Natrinema thermotolerans TaxID=121872 RepID=A0AAF0PEU8_9EURY|nr:hypothetical protein [Natrinema thermotolerans]WMT09164.1 hypothetical protein NP511_05900 [Natrinema thermotolerans]
MRLPRSSRDDRGVSVVIGTVLLIGMATIGLTEVQRLTAGETEIKLQDGGSCGTWDGSGDLEEGDVTTVDKSDCGESLDKGDVLQVIGSETLLDTYELRE